MGNSLAGKVAVVAGATRGAGRGIAVELGARGTTVFACGRTSRDTASPMGRPETIEETADLVTKAGGEGIAIRCDFTSQSDVESLRERLEADAAGRIDVLVNDVWGGDPFVEWGKPFWEHDLERSLTAWDNGMRSHLIALHRLTPLVIAAQGLIIEITDGDRDDYYGSLFYDVVKAGIRRLGRVLGEDLGKHGVTALALTPGFLRSEAMLEGFGVTEQNWRDAAAKDPHFGISETPHYVGRAVAALAADPDVHRWNGKTLSSWQLAHEYDFTDVDGSRPDWGAFRATVLADNATEFDPEDYR
ncbi:SDR family oxidoreductase [Micromonospora sp. NPDC007271]|uniref:SDR family oxidoreductase n=1 Tax=Micromonospora sp. NPDC007271 TaxID=3154587 RepID=UPI0033E0892F